MSVKLGLTNMPIVMGLTKVTGLMCSLHDDGQNQNQSNGIP